MAEAKVISDRMESVLRDLNLSALESYREAKDDLLDNESDRESRLADRGRHGTREALEKLGAFSTMARHVSARLGKENEENQRALNIAGTLGTIARAHRK